MNSSAAACGSSQQYDVEPEVERLMIQQVSITEKTLLVVQGGGQQAARMLNNSSNLPTPETTRGPLLRESAVALETEEGQEARGQLNEIIPIGQNHNNAPPSASSCSSVISSLDNNTAPSNSTTSTTTTASNPPSIFLTSPPSSSTVLATSSVPPALPPQNNTSFSPPLGPDSSQGSHHEEGQKNNDQDNVVGDDDDDGRKRKRRRPRACTVCGHLQSAFKQYHKPINLAQNKHIKSSTASSSYYGNNSSSSISRSKNSTSPKNDLRAWPCTHPHPLTDDTTTAKKKYMQGTCCHECQVCKDYLAHRSSSPTGTTYGKKRKV